MVGNMFNLIFGIVWIILGILELVAAGTFFNMNGHVRILLGITSIQLYLKDKS
jgi:tryptophan-rich sensory protein